MAPCPPSLWESGLSVAAMLLCLSRACRLSCFRHVHMLVSALGHYYYMCQGPGNGCTQSQDSCACCLSVKHNTQLVTSVERYPLLLTLSLQHDGS